MFRTTCMIAFIAVFAPSYGTPISETAAAVSPSAIGSGAPFPGPVRIGRYGMACRLHVQDRVTDRLGSINYRVADIGKAGVPKLSADSIALIHRIERYKSSKTLWFTFTPPQHPKLIIFDTRTQPDQPAPCSYSPGYEVLNIIPGNFIYESGEETTPNATMESMPTPWMTATPEPQPVRVGRYGLACKPSSNPNIIGPPSYRDLDVGKPGVPKLTGAQAGVLFQLDTSRRGALRFAFVPNPDRHKPGRFIVFYGGENPCAMDALILNGKPGDMYDPGTDPLPYTI